MLYSHNLPGFLQISAQSRIDCCSDVPPGGARVDRVISAKGSGLVEKQGIRV